MVKPLVFMFSGQGSQYYHMGKELFEENELFRKWLQEFDTIITDIYGKSPLELIYHPNKNKGDDFSSTVESSLAIIVIELAMTKLLMEYGINPDYLLGASLGEVTSAIIAETSDLNDTLTYLINRLEYFEGHCGKGKMIGILDNPTIYDSTPILRETSEIAAVNFDSHFVISCRDHHVEPIEEYLKTQNIVFQTLPVSIAFHSSAIDVAKAHCLNEAGDISLKPPKIKFVSSTHARQIDRLKSDYFWDVFRQPIQFQKTIQNMEASGNFVYIDLGPAGTLANFVKYNLKKNTSSAVFPILNPFGQDVKNLERLQQFILTN